MSLAVKERARFGELEVTVERGLHTFVEVGQALAEIRDERLYREGHATFEAYCQERWRMDRRNANRMIEAAAIVETLGSIDPKGTRPFNLGQARELAPLVDKPEEMRAAFAEASAGGKPTAKKIRAAVRKRTASPEEVVAVVEPGKQLSLFRLEVTAGRVERWEQAAAHAGVTVDVWASGVLDEAAR